MKPGSDDLGDPELTLAVPDEADEAPRLPRGRQNARIGQGAQGRSDILRLRVPGAGKSVEEFVE
jgi:hypothetical protein